MPDLAPLDQLASIAPQITGIDVDCHHRHGQDWRKPILGLGNPVAPWCFFGKPIGNKAWPLGVRRKCHPALLQLLAGWGGTGVITFGEAAFKWFGLGSSEDRRTIEQFWARADKYEAQLPISVRLAGVERRVSLYPVPHPSGANAAWASRFPDLLRARLRHSRTA